MALQYPITIDELLNINGVELEKPIDLEKSLLNLFQIMSKKIILIDHKIWSLNQS